MTARDPRGEFELIERFRRMLPRTGRDLVIGPGDDCAGIALDDERLLLLTCDAMVEGRHFSTRHLGPRELGRRLAAVNLSDVAAMGGQPGHALLSLVLDEGREGRWAEELARGTAEELERHGAWLVGGNLAGSDGPLVLDLTLTGTVERDRVLRRSGARPGDRILLTGRVGASRAGLALLDAAVDLEAGLRESLVAAQLHPRPRVAEGRIVALSGLATAMIDVSDGLAADLGHVCRESGVGCEVRLDALPSDAATRAAARALGLSLEALLLGGGEDYELLFTVSPDAAAELVRQVETTGTRVTPIGRIVAEDEGLRFVDRNGVQVEAAPAGWDHLGKI